FQKKLERETTIRECFETPLTMNFPEDLEDTEVPTLEQLGFNQDEIEKYKTSGFIGGEREANNRLSSILEGTLSEDEFVLSPWLATGSLSVHSVYFSITQSDLPKKVKERIIQGLWWKDYFRFMFKKHGNIFFQEGGYTGKPPVLADNQDLSFQKWKEGNTLDPNINIIMQQLDETGYIDFHSRMVSASYLIDVLKVNWLLGAAYFEEKLIDYAPSSNYGNWAHMAGVGSSSNHNRGASEKIL